MRGTMLTARQQLDNLAIEEILAMPDDELLAEFIEDGGDVDACVARGRATFAWAKRTSLIAACSGIIEHRGVRYAITWEACPWCGGDGR